MELLCKGNMAFVVIAVVYGYFLKNPLFTNDIAY